MAIRSLLLSLGLLVLVPQVVGGGVSSSDALADREPIASERRHTPLAEPVWIQVRIASFIDAVAVGAAVRGARARLGRPECREIFDDFSDMSGRTLASNLESAGRTPEAHFDMLLYYDGASESVCQDAAVLAATTPGSRVIRICPQFATWQRTHPRYAELIILHEVLHSLGLAENPPTSTAITDRVRSRCGR